jgi:hypothetical protein
LSFLFHYLVAAVIWSTFHLFLLLRILLSFLSFFPFF